MINTVFDVLEKLPKLLENKHPLIEQTFTTIKIQYSPQESKIK